VGGGGRCEPGEKPGDVRGGGGVRVGGVSGVELRECGVGGGGGGWVGGRWEVGEGGGERWGACVVGREEESALLDGGWWEGGMAGGERRCGGGRLVC